MRLFACVRRYLAARAQFRRRDQLELLAGLQEIRSLAGDDWASMKFEAIYRRLPAGRRRRVIEVVRHWKAAAESTASTSPQEES